MSFCISASEAKNNMNLHMKVDFLFFWIIYMILIVFLTKDYHLFACPAVI